MLLTEEKEAARGLRGVASLDLMGAHRGLAEAAPSKEELKALRDEAAAKREAAKKDRERAKAEKVEHKHTKVILPGTQVRRPSSCVLLFWGSLRILLLGEKLTPGAFSPTPAARPF